MESEAGSQESGAEKIRADREEVRAGEEIAIPAWPAVDRFARLVKIRRASGAGRSFDRPGVSFEKCDGGAHEARPYITSVSLRVDAMRPTSGARGSNLSAL
jgi:hypothetical protein